MHSLNDRYLICAGNSDMLYIIDDMTAKIHSQIKIPNSRELCIYDINNAPIEYYKSLSPEEYKEKKDKTRRIVLACKNDESPGPGHEVRIIELNETLTGIAAD